VGPRSAQTLKTAIVLSAVFLLASCGTRESDSEAQDAGDLKQRLEKLRSVPYTSVTEEIVDEARSGVLLHDEQRAWPGYNLYCSRVSPEVVLFDMRGDLVHRWSYRFESPDDLCEHATLLANGDLLVVDRYKHLLRLDWNSSLVWGVDLVVHHDAVMAPDGKIYTITLEGVHHRGVIVRFPIIVEMTSGGEETDRWSAYEHLDEIKQVFDRRSFLDTIIDSMLAHGSWLDVFHDLLEREEAIQLINTGELQYDHFHLNTISILPETPLGTEDRRFGEGNLLICFRNVNQIATLDRKTRKVLWAWGEGVLEWPHHPTMLDNGNILIFDNGAFRKYSRVIELDPAAETIVWEYMADPPKDFYTYGKGSAQRLPNGNTLICEGDRGRVLEVNRDGEVVWDWMNPLLEEGHRVQVYRMERIAPEVVEPLLEKKKRPPQLGRD
jgi:hypothetical protein